MKKFLVSLSATLLIGSINIFSYADEAAPYFNSNSAITHRKVISNDTIIIGCVIGAVIIATIAGIVLVVINKKKKTKVKGEI